MGQICKHCQCCVRLSVFTKTSNDSERSVPSLQFVKISERLYEIKENLVRDMLGAPFLRSDTTLGPETYDLHKTRPST